MIFKKIMICFFVVSLVPLIASGSTDVKNELIQTIKSSKCDHAEISKLTATLGLDEDVLFEAAKAGCLDPVLKEISLSKDAPKDQKIKLAETLGRASARFLNYLKDQSSSGSNIASKDVDKFSYALGVFQGASNHACNMPELAKAEGCLQLPKIESAMKLILASDQKVKAATQAESDSSTICPVYFDVKFNERMLEREKGVGRVAGVVDAQKLHEYGSAVSNGRRRLDRFLAAFKRNTGQTYDFKACSDRYDRWIWVQ